MHLKEICETRRPPIKRQGVKINKGYFDQGIISARPKKNIEFFAKKKFVKKFRLKFKKN